VLVVGCGKVQPLVYKKIDQVEATDLWNNSTIRLTVSCYNPNSWGATLKKAKGTIFIDSLYMGTFTFDSSIHIPTKKDFSLPISIKIDGEAALLQVLPSIGKSHFWIKVIGTCKIKKLGIGFNIPIDYEGEQNIVL